MPVQHSARFPIGGGGGGGGGNRTLIDSHDYAVSGGNAIFFAVDDSLYDAYALEVFNAHVGTDGSYLYIRASTDGGVSVNTSGVYARGLHNHMSTGTHNVNANVSGTLYPVTDNTTANQIGNAAQEALQYAEVIISGNDNQYYGIQSRATFEAKDGRMWQTTGVGQVFLTGITHFRPQFSSASPASGRMSWWGIKWAG